MLNATLGPPPAVVGARRADDAGVTKAAPSPDRDGFAGALRDAEPRRQAPARPERPRHHAAGPTNGKLPQDSDADVAGSANDTREPQASDRAVERAADDSAVARSGRDASGDASQDAPQDDQAPAQGAEVAAAIAVVPQVAPAVIEATAAKPDPADPAGTVPAATVAGQTAVAGVSPAPAATATAAASQALPSAESVADPATSAAPVDAEPQQGIAAPKGAATLTLSIGAAPAGDVIVAQAPAGPAAAPAPAEPAAKPAAAPAPAPAPAPSAPAAAASADPGQAAAAGAAPAMAPHRAETASRAGAGVAAPGAHLHAHLAHEVADRVRMSINQGGKEILLDMRPPELGHVVIRMVMHDGVLQAQIVADKPEAARMLEQAMPHLSEALQAQGFDLAGMDIAHHGEPRERFGNPAREGDPADGGDGGVTTAPATAAPAPRADGSIPVDLLV